RLRAYAAKLVKALSPASRGGSPALRDIACTLQSGREALESRLAVVAESVEDLIERLEDYLAGRAHPRVFAARASEELVASGASGGEGESELAALALAGRWAEVAALWIQGHAVPWEASRRGRPWRRIPLPTYPFERKRFWVSTT